jgi:arylsulfatase A-like enzyme
VLIDIARVMMPRPARLRMASCLIACVPFVCGFTSVTRAAEKPLNFVFILIDDLGWRDLGCYGSTFYETPNVDALAASGLRFTNAYTTCPVCSPTRASIQTGKYPARLHTTDYFGAPQPQQAAVRPRFKDLKLLPAPYVDKLPHEETTLAEAFKAAGYATFFAGKWHLGGEGFGPESQGYDVNWGGWSAGSPRSYFSPYKNPKLPDGPPGEHLDMRLADETAKFIEAHQDAPFFAFFAQYDVHIPLQAQPELRAKYNEKRKHVRHDGPRFLPEGDRQVRQVQDHPTYAAMVEMMDRAVGTVLKSLERAGVADHTVVILTSDNGGLSTAEGTPTCNLPLRGGKGWMYEGGIRVPLIVRWPGVTKSGSQTDQYVTSTDFFPTLLEMADLPLLPQQHVDGSSFIATLHGSERHERGPIFWHYPHYGNQGGSPSAAIRDGDWKLIEFFEDGHAELYNLANDISERHDLVDAEPERASTMLRQLHAWQRDVDATMPTPNPNFKSVRPTP